jgi:HlyD family secretion protein
MHKRLRFIPVIVLLAALGGMIWYLTSRSIGDGSFTATGTIEAIQVRISAELGGRVVDIRVNEGDAVAAGDLLLQLDDTLLQAQRAQAEQAVKAADSALLAAQFNFQLLRAGASAEQIAVAEAVVEQARVTADGAQSAYDDLPDAAKDTADGKALKLKADQAAAALATAQAQLEQVKAGARLEQLQAAEAQMNAAAAQADAARAALAVLDVQIGKLSLTAPSAGTVITRSIQPGELGTPGSALLVIADLEHLTVTIYVPEDRYGKINLGDSYPVLVDSFPDETFTGTVIKIADQFEFTPRNVQTADNRKTTVFAVELALDNAGGKLKPGMPVEVNIGK